MKKIFTLSVMLSLVTFIFAQSNDKVTLTSPAYLDEFNTNDINATGVNSNGRFVYGMNASGSAAIYDFESANPFTLIEATPDNYFGISVAGFTPDGRALLSTYTKSYFYNPVTGEEEYIESPDPNYGLDAWDMSEDGKYIGCNLTTEDFFVIPMLAEKQEDGTFKFTYLEYDPEDAMGCLAQYTQVRYISDDASYIIGIQPDNRGMGGRLVIWEKQEDGTYKFTTPLDEFLYDLSVEKPGLAPEWEDFVTADPDNEPELFQQQADEYNKAFDEYELNYGKFTRNQSALEIYAMNKCTRNNTVGLTFYDNRDGLGNNNMISVFYDCETGLITDYPEIINSIGFEQLPGGGHIVATDNGGLYSLTAIDKEGVARPFEEWLNELTGTDISQYYTFTYYDFINDQEIEGVFPGLPYFSNDGKNLVLTGFDPDLGTSSTSILKFDRDVFENVSTGIENVKVTEAVNITNGKVTLNGKQGVAEVYALNGAKCGSYNVNGEFNFNEVLGNGTYVVKMNIENMKPISFKIIVK